MNVVNLEWDSKFFGFKIGKVFLENNKLNLYDFRDLFSPYRLIYIFSDDSVENLPYNCSLLDIKVILEKALDSEIEGCPLLYQPREHSFSELLSLVFLSGTFSRFRLDPRFPPNSFERLYESWILKSITENNSNVIIKLSDQKIAGFISLTHHSNQSHIDLISVHPDFRKNGIGSKLVKEAETLAHSGSRTHISVTTQFNNEPAMNLYLKNGFKIISRTYVYHYWNQ